MSWRRLVGGRRESEGREADRRQLRDYDKDPIQATTNKLNLMLPARADWCGNATRHRATRAQWEAGFGAKDTAGEPSRADESHIEKTADRNARAVGRANHEQLHVIEGGVKTYGEPQGAGTAERIAHQ